MAQSSAENNQKSNEFDLSQLDAMTEEETKQFERRYKDAHLPNSRLYALIPYNLLIGGFCIYYTLNFKHFSRKLFKPKKFGIWELFKYGTIQSSVFVTVYLLGLCTVTGLWHPVQYIRDIATIKGKVIDKTLRHDEQVQKYVLFSAMEYFGMSQEIMQRAKSELSQDRQKLEETKYFSDETKKLLDPKKKSGNGEEEEEDE